MGTRCLAFVRSLRVYIQGQTRHPGLTKCQTSEIMAGKDVKNTLSSKIQSFFHKRDQKMKLSDADSGRALFPLSEYVDYRGMVVCHINMTKDQVNPPSGDAMHYLQAARPCSI